MRNKRLHFVWMFLAAVVLPQGTAVSTETDSLCIHFASTSKNVLLKLERDYVISGVLPLTLCNLEIEEKYRLTVDGHGFERRIGSFSIDGSGRAHFGGIRIRAGIRNALLPGWGSIYAERTPAGIADALSIAAGLYVLCDEELEYRDLRDNFDALSDQLQRAGTFEELNRLQEAAHKASREVNVQNKHRTRVLYLSAYLYGYQVLEPLIADNPPRMRTEAQGSVIDVGAARSTRLKAFLHSLLRPGRGQFYQGKTVRGMLLSTMSVAAGLLALDFYNQYDEEAVRYKLAVAKYNAASTVDERKHYADDASAIWEDVEKQKHRRNAAFITLAGLWGLSLIDTLFPAENETVYNRYALDLGDLGCALVVRF